MYNDIILDAIRNRYNNVLRIHGKIMKPIPIRFPEKVEAMISDASEQYGLTKQEIIRLATVKGLTALDSFFADVVQQQNEINQRKENNHENSKPKQ